MAITISGDSPNFTSVAATTITNVTNISSNAADTPVILGDSGTNYNTCRAWVNFNGTGTPAIRTDFNVTSITDNGTGDYTVNFTTAMPDANYCASVTSGGFTTTDRTILGTAYALATSSVKVNAAICTNAAYYDPTLVSVAIFR